MISRLFEEIAKLVARIGEDAEFIVFNAHCWFAFALVYVAAVHGHGLPAGAMVVAIAAVKEFVFDADEEKDPPQTFMDNLTDFGGYCAGVVLAAGVFAL